MPDRYLVFDWDGTLHNTKKLYAESVRRAYAYLEDRVEQRLAQDNQPRSNSGLAQEKQLNSRGDYAQENQPCSNIGFAYKNQDQLSEEFLSKYLGMTAKQMWDDFMPGLDPGLQQEAEKIVGDSMVELVFNKAAVLYDGVFKLLDELKAKGCGLFILSNCKIKYLEAHREIFGLDRWFMDYYPAQAYDFIPKEEILKLIMDRYPGEYVMIGDRYLDIKAGKECDVKTIGCLYGFGSREELSQADFLVDSPYEIMKLIMS